MLDGKEYQKHSEFLSEKANLSVTLNTDGTDVFRSSTASLYPVWMTINELPPLVRYTSRNNNQGPISLCMAFSSRFNKRNILLVGLWFHQSKPPMATFLRLVIDEMNRPADKA